MEETGIEVEVKSLIETAEKIFRDENGRIQYHYVILDYLCKYVSGELKASSDADEIRAVDLKDIGELDLIEGTREVILKALNT